MSPAPKMAAAAGGAAVRLMARQTSAATSAAAAAATAVATSTNKDAAVSASFASQAAASSAMHSLSAVISSASAALASESRIAAGESSNPPYFKYIGIGMAIASGFFIGSSFVLKKKGLLAAQKKYDTTAGEGVQYLKSFMWWSGMIIMILGEVLNLVAYSFTDAILVTPLGALSVVVCAILSSFFLNEKLSLFGWLGCALCILGSTVIALNGPEQHASGQIEEFKKLFIAPGFLAWTGICIATALVLIFFVVPKYGKKTMLVHITICSVIGGLSVSVTSGLGSAILLSIRGTNQFKHWFIYFLIAFVIVTLLTEIFYLNKALELFNTAMVTPTYYVIFTFMTLVTSIILFQGLAASVIGIVTIVLGFLVICIGITILQLSKIDPEELAQKPGVDRSTTLLLKASRSHVNNEEKGETTQIEDPGVDTIRGSLGIVGSVIRARSSRRFSKRFHTSADEYVQSDELGNLHINSAVQRYKLHDGPVPRSPLSPGGSSAAHQQGARTMPVKRDTAISWAEGADGHDREKRGLGASSNDNHSYRMEASLTNTPDESLDEGILQRRAYHTEPRAGLLRGIHEASGESTASLGATSGKYLDPFSANRPVDELRYGGRSPDSDVRNMWELEKVRTTSSEEISMQDSLSTPKHSDRYRFGNNNGPRREDEELLSPKAFESSEDEEEGAKTGKKHRFGFF